MADQQALDERHAPDGEAPPRGAPPKSQPGARAKAGRNGDDNPGASRRSWTIRIVFAVVVIAALIGIAIYYEATKNQVSTDDAFTDGRVVTIAPRVSGNVVELDINDNQVVHKGDILLRIDPRDYQAARDQAAGQLEVAEAQLDNARAALAKARITFPAQLAAARGNLAAAQGQLFKAETDFKRQHAIARGATTQEQVDASTAALQQAQGMVAQAQAQVQEAEPIPENIAEAESATRQLDGTVAQARAQLAQAELNLSYTIIRAPQDGTVTKRNVEVGDYAQPGSAVLSLVTPDVWVTANFKENQLDRMRPGQKVTIALDAYADITLHGHVDSVQLGSGSKFTAFPAENATGNFVKIVQRVPVKIVIDSGLDPKLQLPLGLSVTPTVDVGSTPDENAPNANNQGTKN
jgi:membrane fusion protein (multidrug efflux system)